MFNRVPLSIFQYIFFFLSFNFENGVMFSIWNEISSAFFFVFDWNLSICSIKFARVLSSLPFFTNHLVFGKNFLYVPAIQPSVSYKCLHFRLGLQNNKKNQQISSPLFSNLFCVWVSVMYSTGKPVLPLKNKKRRKIPKYISKITFCKRSWNILHSNQNKKKKEEEFVFFSSEYLQSVPPKDGRWW